MLILDSSGLNYLPYDEAKLLEQIREMPSLKIRKQTKQTIFHVSRKKICGFNIIHSCHCTKLKSGGLLRKMWEARGCLFQEQA